MDEQKIGLRRDKVEACDFLEPYLLTLLAEC